MPATLLNEADADVLLSILVEELRAQEGLESAIEELEAAVLHQDLDALEGRLEGLAPRLAALEETMTRRERVLGRLSARAALAAGPGTVSSLVARLPESRRDELSEVHERVRGRGRAVREANRRLRVIVSDLARLNQGMVRAAFGVDHAGSTYDRRGATGPTGAASIMDRRL